MRDGIKLHTTVYSPRMSPGPLPIILLRTPYGISGAPQSLQGRYKELADDGYIFAFQDIRGRYTSEGTFVMIRPVRDRQIPGSIDEATDAYDTIDWLVKNVGGNNGRVGMLGVSYDGWLTAMALVEPHPALRAVSPQAPPADMWLGDDFFHNGAFRLSYGFEYAARMETTKQQYAFEFDRYDTFDWYLALGPLSNVNAKHLMGRIPTWNDFVAHPSYDEFWKRQTIVPHLTEVTRADAQRRRLVGPGGFLRARAGLRGPRGPRHRERELPRRRSLEPRRVERRRRQARRHRFRDADGALFPGEYPGPVLRLLPQRQGRAAGCRSDHL